MTLKELILLDEEGGIPDFLKRKWKERHGEDPIEIARAHLRNNQIEGIVLCAFILIIVLLTASFCFSVKFEIFPSILVGLASTAGVGMMIFHWKDRFVPHESSTSVGKFAQNFGKLRSWVDWEMNNATPEESLRAWADFFLTEYAYRFLMLEQLVYDFSADYLRWDEHTRTWREAEKSRNRFKERHQALFELGLADEKWNRYFAEAQARLEAKRS